jgi:hypothetical protein
MLNAILRDFKGMAVTYRYDTGTDRDVDPEGVEEFFSGVAQGRHTAVVCTLARYPNAVSWKRHIIETEDHEEDALHLACENGQTHIAEILLDAKADIESVNWAKAKSTPLLAATCGHHEKTVALLLARGANPNKTDGEDYSPLLYAACGGQTGIAGLLLQHGANPDVKGGRGVPALGMAVAAGDEDMVKLLVNYNADPRVTDNEGDDVYVMAASVAQQKNMGAVLAQAVMARDTRLRDDFDRAIADMSDGTKTPLTLRRPLRLKAAM